ncbi:hypothetical protein Pmani_033137 [Petrolisthes manimaculis]|uniref:Uncharacterized protein n=1 Tax=Petrolisthes manimaculis TaxID=1843537 RepID=A0AAE1NS68_9EUCA|nr:hypothetical protein Pmani_033137 [Petrolisthes manimaculis]
MTQRKSVLQNKPVLCLPESTVASSSTRRHTTSRASPLLHVPLLFFTYTDIFTCLSSSSRAQTTSRASLLHVHRHLHVPLFFFTCTDNFTCLSSSSRA